jgi:hypothetical protein
VTARQHDRSLTAVRRVREARERDSRLGLQRALAASRQRDAEARQAAARLAAEPAFGSGTPIDLTAHVARTTWLAAEQADAVRRADASRAVAAEAAHHWQLDRQQVRVVDLLLDRRARARAEERARREARELDDLAAQGWLRRSLESGQETR